MPRHRQPKRSSKQHHADAREVPASDVAPDIERAVRTSPGWRWRTFPVATALVIGLVIGAFTHSADSDFAIAVRIIAVFGAAYVVIHLFVTNVVVAGRMKRRDEAKARGALPDDAYEDVVVPPGD